MAKGIIQIYINI